MKADSLQNMAVVSTEDTIDSFIQEPSNLTPKRRKAPGHGSSPRPGSMLFFTVKGPKDSNRQRRGLERTGDFTEVRN